MDYKIKYNNFFDYLELKNIIASKRIILRKNKARLYNYMHQFYMIVFAFILFYISYSLSYGVVFRNIFLILSIFSLFIILYFLISFLVFIIQFHGFTKGRKGTMTFSKSGIVDYSDKGYICGFSWDKIQLIIVGKKSMVIFSKFPFCLFVNAKDSKEVIDNVKKYNKDVLVVERKK